MMKKISIVVPYRNREEHLAQFTPFMEEILSKAEGYSPEIIIVEQDDDKPFNRAKLLNIGYAESKDCDCFCFHDVDMLPLNPDYSPVEAPTHLAAEVEQFNWGLAYDGYFGGVTMFDKESFEKINGYANEYWGWGAEDDDVLSRCLIMDIGVFRKSCRYKSLAHGRSIDNNLYNKNLQKLHHFKVKPNKDAIMKDGLSTLTYEKTGEEKIGTITRKVRVKI